MKKTLLQEQVANHIARYREGSDSCPRTKNKKDSPMPQRSYNAEYIAEWDRQMLVLRAKMFKRGVK